MISPDKFAIKLFHLNACNDAKIWARGKSDIQAWETCPRADWLLWWAHKEHNDLRSLTLANARCAKSVSHLIDEQPFIDAINNAELFGLSQIDQHQLQALTTNVANKSDNYFDSDVPSYAIYARYAAYRASQLKSNNPHLIHNYDSAKPAALAIASYSKPTSLQQNKLIVLEHLATLANIVRENINPSFL